MTVKYQAMSVISMDSFSLTKHTHPPLYQISSWSPPGNPRRTFVELSARTWYISPEPPDYNKARPSCVDHWACVALPNCWSIVERWAKSFCVKCAATQVKKIIIKIPWRSSLQTDSLNINQCDFLSLWESKFINIPWEDEDGPECPNG